MFNIFTISKTTGEEMWRKVVSTDGKLGVMEMPNYTIGYYPAKWFPHVNLRKDVDG